MLVVKIIVKPVINTAFAVNLVRRLPVPAGRKSFLRLATVLVIRLRILLCDEDEFRETFDLVRLLSRLSWICP
jgi:hypothetical protein